MKLALKALQKMAKYFSGFVIALLLAGCEMSQEEKTSVAAITCSIMSETRNMDGAVRVEKINEAREKIGGKAFLSGDDKIKESFELGLCETLVVDPDQYKKMVTAIEAKERQIERERKIAWKRAEEKRIARTRDALEEWKSAILDRINSASDIIKDATFDVSFSDDSPIKIEYNCSFMKHLDHTLIVSFDNELGYLLGRNSVGSCSGSQKIDAIKLDFEDSDRENLYSVIDSVTRGSLLHSVISVDLKINDSKITDFVANNAKQRAEFKYVDPTNFHPDLRNGDLRNSPIVVRIYDAEKARIAEKNRVKKQKAAAEQRAKKLADELAAKKRKIAQVIRNYRLTAVEELKKYTFTKGKSGTTKFNDGLEINIDPNPLLRRVWVNINFATTDGVVASECQDIYLELDSVRIDFHDSEISPLLKPSFGSRDPHVRLAGGFLSGRYPITESSHRGPSPDERKSEAHLNGSCKGKSTNGNFLVRYFPFGDRSYAERPGQINALTDKFGPGKRYTSLLEPSSNAYTVTLAIKGLRSSNKMTKIGCQYFAKSIGMSCGQASSSNNLYFDKPIEIQI